MEVCSRLEMDPKTVLLKINGTLCNLNCLYCSETKKEFKHKISIEQIKMIFKQLPSDTAIILHGGEPLLDFEYFKQIFYLFKEANYTYKLSVQTNGVIKPEIIDFLCENSKDINIGISIDGTNEQNVYRVDSNSNQTFNLVVRTMRYFEEKQVNIKCIVTVNDVSVNNPNEILDFFLTFTNVKQIRFNPCFDSYNGLPNNCAVNPVDFLDFLRIVAGRWINEKIYKKIHIDPMQSLAEKIMDNSVNHSHYLCNNYISIYSDNRCTLCDFLGDDHFVVDDYSTLFDTNRCHSIKNSQCDECPDYTLCGGGCNAIMARFSNNVSFLEDYCKYRKGLSVIIRDFVKK